MCYVYSVELPYILKFASRSPQDGATAPGRPGAARVTCYPGAAWGGKPRMPVALGRARASPSPEC